MLACWCQNLSFFIFVSSSSCRSLPQLHQKRAKAGLLHLTKDKPCNNLLSYIYIVQVCCCEICTMHCWWKIQHLNPGGRRRQIDSILLWQMVQNYGQVPTGICQVPRSSHSPQGANNSKTWYGKANLTSMQTWTEYNNAQAQQLKTAFDVRALSNWNGCT